MRRPVVILALAATLLGPAPVGAAAVPVLVIDGKGHGHGVGMAQDGALTMGKGGSTTAQILSQFYPGTTIGRAAGEVRVGVLTAASNTVVVRFPNGGEVRDARDGGQSAGFPVRVAAGGQARLRFDGRQFMVETAGGGSAASPVGGGGAPSGGDRAGMVLAAAGPAVDQQAQEPPTPAPPTTTTTGLLGLLPLPTLPPGPLLPLPAIPPLTATTSPPSTSAPPATTPGRVASNRSLWAVPNGGGTVDVAERGARYRGVLQTVGGSPLRLVNHLDVEQYLRGMGEVRNPSWPPASLRAQAIAARTYAMRAVAGGGELCDTQQCQVYLGAQAEYAAMDKAVTATKGQVLTFRKALVSAVYSANGGGFSASTEEGFGTPGAGYPYLRPAQYPTSDPGTWSVTVALRDIGARVGYRGKVATVRTQAGPSGRVVQVTVEGSSGARTVNGIDFDRALGLRSTLFTVRPGEAAEPPPPPPPAEGGEIQGLPGSPDVAPGDPAAVSPPAVAPSGDTSAGAPVAIAASAPTPASKAALGALAWILLMATTSAVAATLVSRPRRLSRPPPA